LKNKLKPNDLRSIGKSNQIANQIHNQSDFDLLFKNTFSAERSVAMHAIDAIEKITSADYTYLKKYKPEILNFLKTSVNKEFQWHLAILVTRLPLSRNELGIVWDQLSRWAIDKKQSRIVRVNSIQGMFNLLNRLPELHDDLNLTLAKIEKEEIPSINARIRKFRRMGL
jgi:hypothetical protein